MFSVRVNTKHRDDTVEALRLIELGHFAVGLCVPAASSDVPTTAASLFGQRHLHDVLVRGYI